MNQLRFVAPCFSTILGTHQHQIAVCIRMADTLPAKKAPVWRSSEGGQQLAVRTPHNRRKCRVELRILVDNNILQHADLSSHHTRCDNTKQTKPRQTSHAAYGIPESEARSKFNQST